VSLPAAAVGLDVGSTTVKAVAVKDGAIAFRAYRRHQGRPLPEARALLAQAWAGLEGARVAVTGSAGAGLARQLGVELVHEVHAVAAQARAAVPGVRTVIELGGQDAKMIHLDERGGITTEMNERCAAGTGVVIDRCAHRLGLPDALASLGVDGAALPTVSARCGVFAETDLVGLVKAGHRAEVALAALLEAIVRQNLIGLSRGRPLLGPVCLLGGPNAFIPALAASWQRQLQSRWRERGVEAAAVVVPEDAALFAALGAVRLLDEVERVQTARGRKTQLDRCAAPLAPTPARVPAAMTVERPAAPDPSPLDGPLQLGLDAGSTTVKAVALDRAGAVVARAYRKSGDDVFADTAAVMAELAQTLGARAAAVGSLGVTGYAADLLGPLLGADAAPVETLAHARSALRFVPGADVVCDVGGQDIKVLMLEGGHVRDFRLSHQCAAGAGALLEATAAALGVPLDLVAEVTSRAERVPHFSLGCAVFLDTERVTAQRDGMQPSELLAGITAALPRIVWENVAAVPSLEALGRVFVLSGGVQRNAAAVRAQAAYIAERHPSARVVVHPFPGEAGAIGAALAGAAAVCERRTAFVGLEAASRLACTAVSDESTRCRRCPSHCSRTLLTPVGSTRTLVTGHGCERGEQFEEPPNAAPPRPRDLVRLEVSRLFRAGYGVKVVSDVGRDLRIAIPRVLGQYRAAALFIHYFESLGVPRGQIRTGEFTSEALWRQFAGHGTTDACFPAKVAQAHVAALLAQRSTTPFDVLFFPRVTHAVTGVKGCNDTAACPVVASTPLVTRVAFGAGADGVLEGGVRLLTPALPLSRKRELSAALYESVRSVLPGLTLEAHEAALTEGRSAQRRSEHLLEQVGAKAIREAARTRHCAVVMLGRPYHADPGLQHELSSTLSSMGRTALTLRALPHSDELLASIGCTSPYQLDDLPFLTNSGDGERVVAARIVGQHPFLVGIELSSFKCGQDAALYGVVAAEARGRLGKPFLALHDLDETRPVASLRLRLRTFLDAVEDYEARAPRTHGAA
jgi:predicted CoA-substrate-specific enzyme activase